MQDHCGDSLIDWLALLLMLLSKNKLAGAGILLCVAMVWANSPWTSAYFGLLATPLSFGAS